jgi:hypothetical protein
MGARRAIRPPAASMRGGDLCGEGHYGLGAGTYLSPLRAERTASARNIGEYGAGVRGIGPLLFPDRIFRGPRMRGDPRPTARRP